MPRILQVGETVFARSGDLEIEYRIVSTTGSAVTMQVTEYYRGDSFIASMVGSKITVPPSKIKHRMSGLWYKP